MKKCPRCNGFLRKRNSFENWINILADFEMDESQCGHCKIKVRFETPYVYKVFIGSPLWFSFIGSFILTFSLDIHIVLKIGLFVAYIILILIGFDKILFAVSTPKVIDAD